MWIVGGPGSYPDTAVLSDSRGQFTLSIPEAAKYELACGADGYIQGLAIVDFTDATDITIDFELKPDSV